MAWDKRGYLYRSRRVGGKVVRDYYGVGPLAEAAAYLIEVDRLARQGQRRQRDARRAAFDAAEEGFHILDKHVALLAAAHLIAAGYYRHDRGPWRRRRNAPADRPV